MSRPRTDSAAPLVQLGTRVPPRWRTALQQLAQAAGMSEADYVRQVLGAVVADDCSS